MPSPHKGKHTPTFGDRFIPLRHTSPADTFALSPVTPATSPNPKTNPTNPTNPQTSPYPSPSGDPAVVSDLYTRVLQAEVLGSGDASPSPHTKPQRAPQFSKSKSPTPKILRYNDYQKEPLESPFASSFPLGPSTRRVLLSPPGIVRKMATSAYKILEAPNIQDDFYLNLLHWSSQDVLAVALGETVFLWQASTGQASKLLDLAHLPGNSNAGNSRDLADEENSNPDNVTSVSFMQRGTQLAVGTNRGHLQIWDVVTQQLVTTMMGHRGRIGSLSWNAHVLSSGSRDRVIQSQDVRVRPSATMTARLVGHHQEVCGLRWSPDGKQLASGGNDNKLMVWDAGKTAPLMEFAKHQAAVKAIAWSPFKRGLLTSGGGTADRCIHFWSTITREHVYGFDTGSQVCNLAWSKNVNEVVSTHGYSQNQIVVWKNPGTVKMEPLATLTGHTMRVLYLATSPDGQSICTAAGDESIRFWKIWPGASRQNKGVERKLKGIR